MAQHREPTGATFPKGGKVTPDSLIGTDGRFAYDKLERVLHERSRLGILSGLLSHPEGLVFNDLKRLCALTDGNLSRQLQVLSDAGLVTIWKTTGKGRPQTLLRLTDVGRQRFVEYIAELEQVVRDAQVGQKLSPEPRGRFRLA